MDNSGFLSRLSQVFSVCVPIEKHYFYVFSKNDYKWERCQILNKLHYETKFNLLSLTTVECVQGRKKVQQQQQQQQHQ